jgi:hypothetical protein
MIEYGIALARTEIRSCGWLAQADEHGGSIFHFRPKSKGAKDMTLLIDEVIALFNGDVQADVTAAAKPADAQAAAVTLTQHDPIA